jgi:ABC-type sulfate transport system permease component
MRQFGFFIRVRRSNRGCIPIWLSIRVALLATVITAVAGVPLAWVLARRHFQDATS